MGWLFVLIGWFFTTIMQASFNLDNIYSHPTIFQRDKAQTENKEKMVSLYKQSSMPMERKN